MDEEVVKGMVSVVIPAYNEPALRRVVEAVRCELDKTSRDYEILVIDDASTVDCTSEVMGSDKVRVHRQLVNGGYGASLKEGILRARGEVVVTLDGDGQHRPADIGGFLDLMDQGADAVLGTRGKVFHSSLWRMPGKWLLLGLVNCLSHRKVSDINCGFRAFRTRLIRRYLPLCCDRFSFSTTSALAVLLDGRKVAFLTVDVEPREGSSTVRCRDGFSAMLSVMQIIMLFAPFRILLPPSLMLLAGGGVSLARDIIRVDITQGTVLLLVGGLLFFFFGLLADQISSLRKQML